MPLLLKTTHHNNFPLIVFQSLISFFLCSCFSFCLVFKPFMPSGEYVKNATFCSPQEGEPESVKWRSFASERRMMRERIEDTRPKNEEVMAQKNPLHGFREKLRARSLIAYPVACPPVACRLSCPPVACRLSCPLIACH